MTSTLLNKKLGIKPGYHGLILNAPVGYVESLGELPDGASVVVGGDGPFDFVQVFVYHKADVDARAQHAISKAKPSGMVWFTYPKKSRSIKTDISRDTGWDAAINTGWHPVATVSVDETWSALRFRVSLDIESDQKPRSNKRRAATTET